MNAIVFAAVLFAPPEALQLPQLLDEVGERAPEVRVEQAEVDVAGASVGVAGAWEDPLFTVMGESIPGTADDPTMITYRVSQPLNVFGRRGLAKRSASADVGTRKALLARAQWDARAQAVALFYELWMTDELAKIIDEQLALLGQMREAGLARVRAGMEMGHHDVLRAEAEIERLEAERISLDDERAAISAMLNALRGRPQDTPIGEAVLPARSALPTLAAVLGSAGLAPEIVGARAMREGARAKRGLAKKMYLPMIMVEGEYEQRLDGMPDAFGMSLVVSVPLWFWDRQDNEVRMADAMVVAADRDVDAMQTMTEASLRMAWSRARAAERRLEALESSAIPKLEQTIDSARSSYEAGKGEFLVLLDAVMALQDLRMERLEAIVDAGVARFELARILGAPLTEVTP